MLLCVEFIYGPRLLPTSTRWAWGGEVLVSPGGREQQLGSGDPWLLPVSGSPGLLAGGPAHLQEETPLDLYDSKVLCPGRSVHLLQTGC